MSSAVITGAGRGLGRAIAEEMIRFLDAFPGIFLRMLPLLLRDAERLQRRYRKLIESGRWPKRR